MALTVSSTPTTSFIPLANRAFNNSTVIPKHIIDQLKIFEGFEETPYPDAFKTKIVDEKIVFIRDSNVKKIPETWAIGYGRQITDKHGNPVAVLSAKQRAMKVTREEAEVWLTEDLDVAYKDAGTTIAKRLEGITDSNFSNDLQIAHP